MLNGIILANGKSPGKSVLKFLFNNDYSCLICADGGANSARKLNLIPNYIIGDLDSIKIENLKYFQKKSVIFKLKDQNSTDVEKCLNFMIKKKYTNAVLCGVSGNRLDHTFCNLGIVLKFFDKISISIIAEKSFLKAYKGIVELKTIPGETLSIYGFDKKTKIRSKGLKFPLNNIDLPFGKRESTSNMAISSSIKLVITGGPVFIIRDFNLMKKNGFI